MEKTELILGRDYSKGDQLQALYVRVVSGGDIYGVMFRFETWKNNKEDESLRVESGDVYLVQTKFFTKLLDLFEDRWKRERIRDGEAKQYMGFFNPEVL
jgi:hypothetical protein